MDNSRFNVTGASFDELVSTLVLFFKLHHIDKSHPALDRGYGSITGYSIDPYLGMVLYQYPLDRDLVCRENIILIDPIVGSDPEAMGRLVWYQINQVKVTDPEIEEYDQYEEFRTDFSWDCDCDHDGDNGFGWRAFSGKWGHIPNRSFCAILAIRPIFAWYGK